MSVAVTTVTSGELVPGAFVEMRTDGGAFTSKSSGRYDGVRQSEHDGGLCVYFTDGEIEGRRQSLFGFPLARLAALPGPVQAEVARLVADAMQSGIRLDIDSGIVPRSVTSFEDLHDYVDANEYGGEPLTSLEEALGEDRTTYINILNSSTDLVDAWLRAGRRDG